MGKSSDDRRRARSLLSSDGIPTIKVPRAAAHEHREFKLPDQLQEPVPSRERKRRRRSSTARFRDRTLGWFKTGDELEDAPGSDSEVEVEVDENRKSSMPLVFIFGAVALIAIGVVLAWLR